MGRVYDPNAHATNDPATLHGLGSLQKSCRAAAAKERRKEKRDASSGTAGDESPPASDEDEDEGDGASLKRHRRVSQGSDDDDDDDDDNVKDRILQAKVHHASVPGVSCILTALVASWMATTANPTLHHCFLDVVVAFFDGRHAHTWQRRRRA